MRKRLFCAYMSLIGVLVFILRFRSFYFEYDHCRASENGCSTVEPTDSPKTLLIVEQTFRPSSSVKQKYLENVYISIKSTAKYHYSRLNLLFLTWFETVPPQNIYVVTDEVDNVTDTISQSGINLVYSSCPRKHTNNALACKCGDEFRSYYQQLEAGKHYRWYCHFDDDMYVNSPELQDLLSGYPFEGKHYLGRWSVSGKKRLKPNIRQTSPTCIKKLKRDSYYFATGAAYCISKGLMTEMEQYVRGDELPETARSIGVPDDMAVGFIIEAVLGYNLTDIPTMNSHLNPLMKPTLKELPKQITISYGEWTVTKEGIKRIVKNTIRLLQGVFTEEQDPTRFYSYHCLLYPSTSWCDPPRKIPELRAN